MGSWKPCIPYVGWLITAVAREGLIKLRLSLDINMRMWGRFAILACHQLCYFHYTACISIMLLIMKYLWSFYQHVFTLIPGWISNYITHKAWDEITLPFPNFNGGNEKVISYHTLLVMWLLIHAGIKVNSPRCCLYNQHDDNNEKHGLLLCTTQ